MATELRPTAPLAPPHPTTPASHPLAWAAGIGAVGTAVAIGAPILVAVALFGVFIAAVFYLSPGDPTTVLTLGVAAMFVIPQRFVFEPLGAAGTPALLIGVAALVWWLVTRLGTNPQAAGYNPIRIATAILMGTVLLAYVSGWAKPMPFIEGSNADRTLIMWLGYCGYLLLSCDGITSRARLDALMRRVVDGAAFMATVALLQFFAKFDLSASIQPPGLSYNDPLFDGSYARSTFTRVMGTAMHPIEFSVIVASLLPVAIHYAFADTHRNLVRRWAPVALMGFAMPLAISRSGFLALFLAAACFIPALPPGRKTQVVALGAAGGALMTVAVPGLLGTIRSFFTGAATDPSVTARTDDYQYLDTFFNQWPFTGLGFGRFTPSVYDVLDNQYLLTIIDSGVIGLIGLLLFLVSGLVTAQVIRKRPTADASARSLAQACFGGILAHVATFATYDALVFPTTGMVLFLLIGVVGALWRLTRPRPLGT
ncbi:MAG: hypothetical protein GEV08_23545 [Acidimicrobiia bacterium]|nr:hypothetical protein [Acidimicrobiia bacterium]